MNEWFKEPLETEDDKRRSVIADDTELLDLQPTTVEEARFKILDKLQPSKKDHKD